VSEDTTPVLIGAGQLVQRDVDPQAALGPVAMMAEAARRAAADAGAGAHLLMQVDLLAVVNVIGWQYGNAPRLLAELLDAHPAENFYTTIGGNTPQWLVNETAARIAAGEVRLALIAGAEAVHTVLRARQAGFTPRWPAGEGQATVVGDPRLGTSEHEANRGIVLPAQIYPLFENALRAARGWSIAEHRRRLGVLCTQLSTVAAGNPYAWFQRARSAEEITTATPANRMIAFPYTKYMNAIMDVDQAAAVLLTSAGHARTLGVDPARWVYVRGTGDAHDLWFVSERSSYHASPAIRAAGRQALAMAGLDISDVDHLDLYSCFPSAVQIGRAALGIPDDDPRSLTVTGGLPYAGGPGNNYSMHAIASMMEKLRARPGTKGLVSALGWYLTKHSVGVYASEPGPGPWRRPELAPSQAELDRLPHPALASEPSGRGVIETYTVVHDRDGSPARGIVIGRLDDGRRFLADTPEDREVLEDLEAHEGVGRAGTVTLAGGTTRFAPE